MDMSVEKERKREEGVCDRSVMNVVGRIFPCEKSGQASTYLVDSEVRRQSTKGRQYPVRTGTLMLDPASHPNSK